MSQYDAGLHLHAAGAGPAVLRPRAPSIDHVEIKVADPDKADRRCRPIIEQASRPGAIVTDWTRQELRASSTPCRSSATVMRLILMLLGRHRGH